MKKLVNLIQNPERDLEQQDKNGNTAFCHAIIAGSVTVAKILLKKDPELAFIRGAKNLTPLYIAVISGCPDMARLLFQQNEKHLHHLEWEHLQQIFFTSIETDMFGKHMLPFPFIFFKNFVLE